MSKIYVLDTNAILTDDDILEHYADKDIALPETVLQEVDKIKVGRADADTRYRGRAFTRTLFEIADGRSLKDGFPTDDGGSIRVLSYDNRRQMPQGLVSKNPDDRIVASAVWLQEDLGEGHEVVMVTNDLNMLLKAQSSDLSIVRHEDTYNQGFMQRFVVKPFQKYRTPLTILLIAIAIFAATIFVATRGLRPEVTTTQGIPSEFRNFVTEEQATLIDGLIRLQTNASDPTALRTVAEGYLDLYEQTVMTDPAKAATLATRGVEYFGRLMNVAPDDTNSRISYGILSFYAGNTDEALVQLVEALSQVPDDVRGNYYLGVVYMQGRQDLDKAEQQFTRVVELSQGDASHTEILTNAQLALKQIAVERDKLSNPTSDGVIL